MWTSGFFTPSISHRVFDSASGTGCKQTPDLSTDSESPSALFLTVGLRHGAGLFERINETAFAGLSGRGAENRSSGGRARHTVARLQLAQTRETDLEPVSCAWPQRTDLASPRTMFFSYPGTGLVYLRVENGVPDKAS